VTGPVLLDASGIDVSYGHVQVLFGVDVQVHDGEVLALLGTNGAGKSTLLKAISGLVTPDRGSVSFEGRSLDRLAAHERSRLGIVQVPGGKAVFPGMSVSENLLAGCHPFRWDRGRIADRCDAVLQLFPPLVPKLDQPAGTMSGGEQQMLAIAKALLLEPRLLLIDELSLGLAPAVVQDLLAVVEGLKTSGVSMVIVEQSVNVALTLAQRAVFMEKGAVRFTGPAKELAERDDLVRAVFLGAAVGG